MLSKIASSSRTRAFSCSRPLICCASFCCAVRSMETLLSAELDAARRRSSSLRSLTSSLRAAVSSCSTSPRSKPAKRVPASYIQTASAAEKASISASPSQRRYQGTCVRTETFGAAMPKRWRSLERRPATPAPLRNNRYLLEAGVLRQAEHQIHVLHRLAGCALHEIVDHREHHQRVAAPGALRRPVHRDAADVRRARRAGIRVAARRHDVDERLLGVALFVQRLEIHFLCDAPV